ncbi:hypothetical protein AYM40_20915 [Paraburkholderia phytofirmans OLGA172]|uniref:Uncharacterized protein n=1 Tax=Paraburkholderia phytofirmans OLGA172 TaxID=1417228 RepID=A0A160FPZ1_9BURK|nr:hypothetical protein [Paraburkholderia phytofirmans]ANB74915.1 hypothetical protein AYM40_20915 [Paraburkholderia phytofirmans OLGA172]
MNNVELYFCDEKKLSRSEKIVLRQVIEWLVENNVPAVVLTNCWLDKTQIDSRRLQFVWNAIHGIMQAAAPGSRCM